ncbi:MAG: HU family DNA-binding protein [Gammaproteobacteria bacterium]|nr:HU family DNA-binding protein [Gammaproteobacteria bacterium]MDP2139577.1 HU family DNA-binding protein [Gammaproteobacteria bacterium]MDP2346550.1 HU family DNA-binding protein [Gammaproteobacteria bacterium]
MHKPDLAAAIALQTDVSRQVAGEVLNTVLDEITNALAFNQRVSLPGLGVLAPVERAARNGFNPASGEAIVIPAHKAVVFRPAKALKEAL